MKDHWAELLVGLAVIAAVAWVASKLLDLCVSLLTLWR